MKDDHMKVLFDGEGIELLENDDRFFLRYDEGELVVQMRDLEITAEEADRVLKNPREAYGIIIGYQNRNRDRV